MDGFAASTKLCWDVGRQKMGIAASDIYVRVWNVTETVEHIHELSHELNLVNDDVIQVSIRNLVMNKAKHFIWVSQSFIQSVFKVDADDMVVLDSLVKKMVVKQHIEQIGLSASANSSYYLDETVLAAVNQLSKVMVSFYLHCD